MSKADTIIVSIPTTKGSWIVGVTVVKRDRDGNPLVMRTDDGTLYTASQCNVVL